MRLADPRTSNSVRLWIVAAAAGLVLAAIGISWLTGREPTEELASPVETTTTTVAVHVPDDCPATIPVEAFVPPDGYPPTPPDGKVWYGSEKLWTVLETDGTSDYQRSSWWSSNLGGSTGESQPEIEVTFKLLGDEVRTVTNSNAIVARTPDAGSFMNVGFQPDFMGCWEVTATYNGTSLTYVYYSGAGRTLTVEVPSVIGLGILEAMDVLKDAELYLTSWDGHLRFEESVCSQNPAAGENVERNTAVRVDSAEPGEECEDLNAKVVVPDVAGLDVNEATAALHAAGLGALIADPIEPGYVVCSQDPQGRTQTTISDNVLLRIFLPGGCEEFLNPNGLFTRTYTDEEGREWYGTDCPAADVLIGGGPELADALPVVGDTERERVESLLRDQGADLAQPGLTGFRALPRMGQAGQTTEDGDVVVVEPTDDYMIKATVDQSFECPGEPFLWNGIPVAFVQVDTN